MKKWKIGIVTQNSSTTYVYIDAPTATEALKIAKMQYPDARGFTGPNEVK